VSAPAAPTAKYTAADLRAVSRLLCGMDAPSPNGREHSEGVAAVIVAGMKVAPSERPNAVQVEMARQGLDRPEVWREIAAIDPAQAAPAPMVSQSQRFVVRWAAEALGTIPPTEWVVEPVFAKGSVNLVVGEGGSKKTYLMQDCGVRVAAGLKWLDYFTTQGTVLLIDEESGNNRTKRRLSALMRGRGINHGIPLAYTSLAQFNLRDAADVALIEALVQELKPALVIIDALADVMPNADENAVKDVQPVFQALRSIAEKYQCAIVVIHHSNKLGGYRGSTAVKAAVDLMLMVDSKPDSGRIDVTTEKARDVEPLTFSALARFDSLTETVTIEPVCAAPKSVSYTKAEDYVLRYLARHSMSTIDDLKSHADSCAPRSAENAVYGLVAKGVVRRVDGGGRGSVATYGLTPKEESPDDE